MIGGDSRAGLGGASRVPSRPAAYPSRSAWAWAPPRRPAVAAGVGGFAGQLRGSWALAAFLLAVLAVPGCRGDAGRMRTKEVADLAGVHLETLRYYERRGLVPEPPRTAGGYRDYPAETVQALRFVKRSQALGFTLAEVEELLHLAEGGPDSCDGARDLAEGHLAGLDRRIAELRHMRAAVVDLLDSCSQPRDSRHCPLLKAIQDEDPVRGAGLRQR